MRHCSLNNYRDVQSTELARHRHLRSINIFRFFPFWAERGVVGFLCEGSFLHSHLRQAFLISTKSPCLFSRLIFVFARKRNMLKEKWSEMKWKRIWYKILHSSLQTWSSPQGSTWFCWFKTGGLVLVWFFFTSCISPAAEVAAPQGMAHD